MPRAKRKVMAVAVASGKVGYVVLRGDELVDWKLSRLAAKSPSLMQETLSYWLSLHTPDVVVTEAINPYSRKSGKTLAIMSAAQAVIVNVKIRHKPKHRKRDFANKYDEIEHLAMQFPAIAPWAPERRKFYDPEPLNTILFEALSLAVQE